MDPSVPLRVLIVEDDDSVRLSLSLLLDMAGAETVAVAYGAAAVDVAHRGFDVFLIDLILGDMDGVMLAHTLTTTAPGTPVIMMSGDSVGLTRAAPVAAYLLDKPIAATTLYRVMAAIKASRLALA